MPSTRTSSYPRFSTQVIRIIPMVALACLSTALGEAEPLDINIDVGEGSRQLSAPLNTSTLRFHIRPTSPSQRFRFKLEGVDKEWKEASDEMNVALRFIDEDLTQRQQQLSHNEGQSEGWNGTVEGSEFESRSKTVTVPEGAKSLSIAVTSAGAPKAVGVIAVKDISVSSRVRGEILTNGRLPNGKEIPWNKAGIFPSMGSLQYFDGEGEPTPVLVIIDENTEGHADLASGLTALPDIVAGEELEVSWKVAYSIGLAGEFTETHPRLSSGRYDFLVEELTVMGLPTGRITRITVEVPGPYWEKWWFWLGSLSLAATLASLWVRAIVKRKINRHLRHAQLLSDERLRIARDLHDDLGTRLSHISLIGAHAESDTTEEAARSSFKQITQLSGELVGALSETVWMLNSKNNDLEALVDFLCRLVSELCRLSDIRCRIDAMQVSEGQMISHELRHNITLSVKESVNNALRHSNGTEIQMKIWKEGSILHISISDNGTGIDHEKTQTESRLGGSGLESISQRMKSIQGTCQLENLEPRGLRVSLTAPIK